MRAVWANEQHSVGNLIDESGHIVVVEAGNSRWSEFLLFGDAIEPAPIIVQSTVQADHRLSFAQMIIGLVTEQFITEQEGEMWLQGTLPQPVIDIIETLPVAQRFAAKAKTSRFIEAMRTDPIVWALADSKGVMPEELDQFFIKYSTI